MFEDKNHLDLFIQYFDFRINMCLETSHVNPWQESDAKVDYDLWIVTDGIIKLEYQNAEYLLQKGDMFLFYPQQLYHATVLSKDCHFNFVHFDVILGQNNHALDEFLCSGYIPAASLEMEREIFIQCYSAFRKEEVMSSLLIKGSFLVLLSQILKYKTNINESSPSILSGKQSLSRLSPVLYYINSNLQRPIYNAELAKLVNMSEKYFISLFKNTIGVTPADYILQQRMKKALQYLSERKYSVKEVSALLGYTDAYTFSKSFKKVYGVPPSQV